MPYKYNPFTGTLDFYKNGSGPVVTYWKDPVANVAALPTVGNNDGDVRVALAENQAYQWDSGSSTWLLLNEVVLVANRAVATDGSGKLVASTVTSTELGFVSGVTSPIQTQINAINSGTTKYKVDKFTLSPTDISNKFVTLTATPTTISITRLSVIGGPEQDYSVDFSVTGNQLSWSALTLDGVLANGDKLIVTYN